MLIAEASRETCFFLFVLPAISVKFDEIDFVPSVKTTNKISSFKKGKMNVNNFFKLRG